MKTKNTKTVNLYGYLFIFFWLHLKKIQKAAFSSSAIASKGGKNGGMEQMCLKRIARISPVLQDNRNIYTILNHWFFWEAR